MSEPRFRIGPPYSDVNPGTLGAEDMEHLRHLASDTVPRTADMRVVVGRLLSALDAERERRERAEKDAESWRALMKATNDPEKIRMEMIVQMSEKIDRLEQERDGNLDRWRHMRARAEQAEAALELARAELARHELNEDGGCFACEWDGDHTPGCSWVKAMGK